MNATDQAENDGDSPLSMDEMKAAKKTAQVAAQVARESKKELLFLLK